MAQTYKNAQGAPTTQATIYTAPAAPGVAIVSSIMARSTSSAATEVTLRDSSAGVDRSIWAEDWSSSSLLEEDVLTNPIVLEGGDSIKASNCIIWVSVLEIT